MRLPCVAILVLTVAAEAAPPGFVPLFDGRTLDGWKALVGNPIARAAMSPEEGAAKQAEADAEMRAHWRAEGGEIVNDGKGPHLCTTRAYRDFELWLDWTITAGADSGIYVRVAPQVQVWDPVNGIDQARVGSGGLYNNQKHRSTPLLADRPAGAWNHFRVRMIGEHVRVHLNGHLVADDVVMENYWDRSRPIFPSEQIELQTHGGEIRFRNLYLREIGAEEANRWLQARDGDGFEPLFNGVDLTGWTGSVDGYVVQEDGLLVCDPASGGILYTADTFADFVLRYEFRLPPGGNNGLAIRRPGTGNPAYEGMEIQILDDDAPKYATLQPYQYCGSIYGVVPAHRGYVHPAGEWNFEEVTCRGSRVTVRLNGTTIIDTDLAEIETTIDDQDHPGIRRAEGHLGFMGHGDAVAFRNIRVKRLGE